MLILPNSDTLWVDLDQLGQRVLQTPGNGDGPASAALDPKPVAFSAGAWRYDTDGDGKKGTDADLLNVVTKGAVAFGGSPLMVGRPDIPEADRKAVVKYVLSLKK